MMIICDRVQSNYGMKRLPNKGSPPVREGMRAGPIVYHAVSDGSEPRGEQRRCDHGAIAERCAWLRIARE